jgi:GNAT superfamily N-acetyltransferase
VEENVRIVPIAEDDWRQLRALRLEMLADTPSAFVETLQVARSFDDAEWRWVGTMRAYVAAPGVVNLVGVYVTPGCRGTGLAARMLATVVSWARSVPDVRTVVLLVHEDNRRAAAFYRRSGFADTGRSEEYPLDRSRREVQMALPL